MTTVDIAQALAALPHFKAVPPDLLTRIASMSKRVRAEAGGMLFHEGDRCLSFFAIELGAVRLYRADPDGREHVVHSLQAGATFAEAAFLSLGRFPVNGVATAPSVLLEIGGDRFLELFRSDVRLAPAMIGSLCMHLVSLVERVEELSLVQAGPRLARWLLRQPAHGKDQPAVDLPLAKKDLAAHLAMTPETLSRLLGRWQEEGWIQNERASVVLRDARSLIALADRESASA